MGYKIATKCKSCRFENQFSFGGGRFTFQTFYFIPAINKNTNEFENVNYIEHGNSDIYIFYTDEKLKGNNYDNKTIDSFDFKLNTVNNYCPNCKEKALGFKIKAFTD